MRTRSAILIASATMLTAATVAGCSSQDTSAATNLVGTWSGTYSYPSVTHGTETSSLSIVITKQEGVLLWGTEKWTNQGNNLEAALVGSAAPSNGQITLAEVGGSFNGFVQDSTMSLQFVRTDDPPTAFYVTLTRTSL
ncbi:MAG: hypothetical protein PHN51_02220 [Candidatus Nanopelagicales bacterium]|nr:hypothetical protein [Candidatus Nanopelagicales bacterium]